MLKVGRAILQQVVVRPQFQRQLGIVTSTTLRQSRFQYGNYSEDTDSSSDEEISSRQFEKGSVKYLGRIYPRAADNDTYDNEIMDLALELARDSFDKEEVPIGAIVLNHKGKVSCLSCSMDSTTVTPYV